GGAGEAYLTRRACKDRPMRALVDLDVAYTTPLDAEALWDYLAARVIAGVEECDPLTYRRAVHLPGGPGVLVLRRSGDQVRAGAVLSAAADAGAARELALRTIDAAADPAAVLDGLGAHPWLGELVRTRPGLRAPHHPGTFEIALRAVLAQQVSLRAARTVTARVVQAAGTSLPAPVGRSEERRVGKEWRCGWWGEGSGERERIECELGITR